MKLFRITSVVLVLVLSLATTSFAYEQEFDTEKIMTELEEKLRLSSEKLSHLKPIIDEKSEELRKSLHETVEKGYLHMDEMSTRLDSVSRETEAKVKEFLTSEEYENFKQYLRGIDKEAITEAKNRLVEDLTEFLELTEEQTKELKPVVEETVQELNKMVESFAEEGLKNWDEFKGRYEELQRSLKEKAEDILDGEQVQKFEEYNKEKIKKIQKNLIEV